MSVSPVSEVYQAPVNERVPLRTLGQSDFIKILTTQLANQNPLKPSDSADMLNQMTQLASIQTMVNMQENLALLRTDQQLTLGQTLIGKDISLADEAGSLITGTVEKVILDGVVHVVIGGQSYPLSWLESILPAPAEPPPPAAAPPPPADPPPPAEEPPAS